MSRLSKKAVIAVLTALLVLSCLVLTVTCSKPLENEQTEQNTHHGDEHMLSLYHGELLYFLQLIDRAEINQYYRNTFTQIARRGGEEPTIYSVIQNLPSSLPAGLTEFLNDESKSQIIRILGDYVNTKVTDANFYYSKELV